MECILRTHMVPGQGRQPPQLNLGGSLETNEGTQLFVSITNRGQLNLYTDCMSMPATSYVIGVPEASGPGLQVRTMQKRKGRKRKNKDYTGFRV